MSAPDTNSKTQKRWHRGPLVGMALALVFVTALIMYWPAREVSDDLSPEESELLNQGAGAPSGDTPLGAGNTAPIAPGSDTVPRLPAPARD